MARTMLTFRDNVAMLRASREEAQTDALTGPRQPARARARARARAAARRRPPSRSCSCCSTSTASSTTTTPSATRRATRCSSGSAAASPRFLRGRGARVPHGRRRVLRAVRRPATQPAEPLDRRAPPPRCSERGEGFEIGCSYGAIELPLEAADVAEALRIADQRMYAQKNAGRASASRQSKDVLLRALAERNPELRAHLSGVAELAEATALRPAAQPRRGRAGPPRRRAARRRQGRHPRRDPRQARAARRGRVGVHPPPHADRRADHRRRARARPRRAARPLQPRALGRRRLPRRPRRRGDPARRADRRGRRRVRRDDAPAPVLAPRARPRRRWRSCAAAPARSSTRRSSRRSRPPGSTCGSPPPHSFCLAGSGNPASLTVWRQAFA